MPQGPVTKLLSQNQGSELRHLEVFHINHLPPPSSLGSTILEDGTLNLCRKHAPQLNCGRLLKIKQAGCPEILAKPKRKQSFVPPWPLLAIGA